MTITEIFEESHTDEQLRV